MGQSLSFDLSYSVWLTHHQQAEEIGREDDDAFAILEELEAFILRHVPRCLDEAASVLNVVRANVETGGRTDGLDVAALVNVMTMLTGVSALGGQGPLAHSQATAA